MRSSFPLPLWNSWDVEKMSMMIWWGLSFETIFFDRLLHYRQMVPQERCSWAALRKNVGAVVFRAWLKVRTFSPALYSLTILFIENLPSPLTLWRHHTKSLEHLFKYGELKTADCTWSPVSSFTVTSTVTATQWKHWVVVGKPKQRESLVLWTSCLRCFDTYRNNNLSWLLSDSRHSFHSY